MTDLDRDLDDLAARRGAAKAETLFRKFCPGTIPNDILKADEIAFRVGVLNALKDGHYAGDVYARTEQLTRRYVDAFLGAIRRQMGLLHS